MQKFQVTPLQLNRFSRYVNGVEGFDEFDAFMDYLNNGPGDVEAREIARVQLFKQSVFSTEFSSLAAKDARSIIPSVGQQGIPFRYPHKGLDIYGKLDFMGFGRGVILDEVERYRMPYYLHDHHNWILKAWEGEMFKRLDYIVKTNDGICQETYTVGTYNFSRIQEETEHMLHFLEQYEDLITNPQITNLKYA